MKLMPKTNDERTNERMNEWIKKSLNKWGKIIITFEKVQKEEWEQEVETENGIFFKQEY